MMKLGIESKDRILQLIEENEIVDFKDNFRKMIIVDQAEKLVQEAIEDVHPGSYYVHAHIADDSIYFKLKQIVDITEYNAGVLSSSEVCIKDKFITIQDVFEQVCETLWVHINSLDGEERKSFKNNEDDNSVNSVGDYIIFKEQLTTIIKENV